MMNLNRGYFEIGIYHPKKEVNVGTLWRSAYQLGATGIFTIGKRFISQASNTTQSQKHIPLREYPSFEEYKKNLPYDCQIVAIEEGGKNIKNFCYPSRISFLLGAEEHGLPLEIIEKCHHLISLDSVRMNSYNVSVAGSIVMYHKNYLS